MLHRRGEVALENDPLDDQRLAHRRAVVGAARQQRIGRAVARVVTGGDAARRRRQTLVPAAVAAPFQLEVGNGVGIDAALVAGIADLEVARHLDLAGLAGRLDRGDGGADVGVVGVRVGAVERDHLGRRGDRRQRRALGRGHDHLAAAVADLVGGIVAGLSPPPRRCGRTPRRRRRRRRRPGQTAAPAAGSVQKNTPVAGGVDPHRAADVAVGAVVVDRRIGGGAVVLDDLPGGVGGVAAVDELGGVVAPAHERIGDATARVAPS